MTESERCTKELIRSVNSNKNKSHRIYSVAMAELIAEKYADAIIPCKAYPLEDLEKSNPDEPFKLKAGAKGVKTNQSLVKIENPDYKTVAIAKAVEENPCLMHVKNDIACPIMILRTSNRLEVTINNTVFNELCREAGIPLELEEIEETLKAF